MSKKNVLIILIIIHLIIFQSFVFSSPLIKIKQFEITRAGLIALVSGNNEFLYSYNGGKSWKHNKIEMPFPKFKFNEIVRYTLKTDSMEVVYKTANILTNLKTSMKSCNVLFKENINHAGSCLKSLSLGEHHVERVCDIYGIFDYSISNDGNIVLLSTYDASFIYDYKINTLRKLNGKKS